MVAYPDGLVFKIRREAATSEITSKELSEKYNVPIGRVKAWSSDIVKEDNGKVPTQRVSRDVLKVVAKAATTWRGRTIYVEERPTSLPGEEWRKAGINGVLVSNKGRCFAMQRQVAMPGGKYRVAGSKIINSPQITVDGTQYTVSHLIASAWIGPRPDGCVVRYLDGDKNNRHVENIVWAVNNPLKKIPERIHGKGLG